MGSNIKGATDAVKEGYTDPKKAALNAVTGGLYSQSDSVLRGTTGKSVDDVAQNGLDAFKGLGGGAKKTSSSVGDAGITAPPTIDANKYTTMGATQAPTAQVSTTAAPDFTQSNGSRGYQDFLSHQLQNQVLGQGPSLAQGQFQQGLDQSIAAQQAMAASQRGGNIAAAQRGAAINTGNINLQGANQAAQLRMQEQLGAEGLLGTTSNQMRSGDLSATGIAQDTGKFNASQTQQGSQFNAAQEQAFNDLRLKYAGLGLSAEQANQAAMGEFNRSRLTQAGIYSGIATGNATNDNAYTGRIYDTVGKLGAAGVAAYTGGASAALTPEAAAAAPAAPSAASQASSGLLPANPDIGYAQPTPGQAANSGFSGAINPTGQPAYSYNQPTMVQTSDRNAKKDIKSGDASTKAFLDALTASSYEYKDRADGAGKQTSVMAQDLGKTDMGKQMVQNDNGVLKVDYGKGQAAMLAAMASLNARLNEIEGAKKAAKKPQVGSKK
jgi:hypothetical protein